MPIHRPPPGLDEQATQRLTELLASLPHAMLVASHQQEFCRRVTNFAVTLLDGKIVERL